MRKYRPFLIIALVLVAAIAGTAWLLRSSWKKDSFIAANSNSQTVSPTPSRNKASADVVVTLEEFGDYQCPLCGTLHLGLKQIKQEFGPSLNFVFRNFPLTTIHKNAMAAAQAAEVETTFGGALPKGPFRFQYRRYFPLATGSRLAALHQT